MESTRLASMRSRIVRGGLWVIQVLSVIMIVISLSGCDDDGPVRPEDVKYNIYVSHQQNEVIYIVDADSLTIIDSIPDVPLAWDIESSADGRWLFVQTALNRFGSATLIKFDLTTKERVNAREGIYSELTILDEGRLLLRSLPPCREGVPLPQLLTTESLQLVEEYDDNLCRHFGPTSASWLATTRNDESELIGSINVLTGSPKGSFQAETSSGIPLDVSTVYLHPNMKWVLMDGRAPNGSKWAVIGDIEADSCMFDLSLASLVGALAISDDGHWGVATDPDRPGTFGEPARINIIDFKTVQSRFIQNLSAIPVQAKFLPGTDIIVLAKEHRDLFMTGPIGIQLIAAGEGKSLRHATLNTNNGRIGGIGVGVRFEN